MTTRLCLGLALAALSFSACERTCDKEYRGDLCFDNRSVESRVYVYMQGELRHTLAPGESVCTENIRAGKHGYLLQYERVDPNGGGSGAFREGQIIVMACEKSTLRIFDDQ